MAPAAGTLLPALPEFCPPRQWVNTVAGPARPGNPSSCYGAIDIGRLALNDTAAKFPFDAARRRILAGAGGALLLSALRGAFAATALDVPVVDELTLHVVVDAAAAASGKR